MTVYTKKIGGGTPFARKIAYEYEGVKYRPDVQNGDMVTILDSGSTVVGQYGEQHNHRITTKNGDRLVTLNQASINVLVDEFGADGENWVNKEVKVLTKKDTIAGKKVIILYLVTDGWTLDEYGELTKDGQSQDIEDDEPFIDLDSI